MKKITEYAFLLTAFSLPSYLLKVDIFGMPSNLLEIFATISIALFFIQKDFRLPPKSSWPIFIFPALMFLGAFFSLAYPGNFSLHGLGIIKSWFIIPIIYAVLASSVFKDEPGKYKFFLALYLSFFSISLISILYKMTGNLTYDGRLSGFYLSPNHLSMFLVFALFIFPYLLFKKQNSVHFIILTISLIPILLAIYFTFSYSVWVAAAFSINIPLITKKDFKKKTFLIVAIFSILSLFLLLQARTEKFSTIFSERSSLSSRMMIWESSLKILLDHPLFGIGPGNFQEKYLEYQKYFTPYLEWAVPQPHNIYLAFWLQAGILGLLSFVSLCILALYRCLRDKNTALSAVCLASFSYILIHGFLDTPFWKNDLAYIFWILVFFCLLNIKPIHKSVYPVEEK